MDKNKYALSKAVFPTVVFHLDKLNEGSHELTMSIKGVSELQKKKQSFNANIRMEVIIKNKIDARIIAHILFVGNAKIDVESKPEAESILETKITKIVYGRIKKLLASLSNDLIIIPSFNKKMIKK